jgi:hypothetical protein
MRSKERNLMRERRVFEKAMGARDPAVRQKILRTSPCVNESIVQDMRRDLEEGGEKWANSDVMSCFWNPHLALSESFINAWIKTNKYTKTEESKVLILASQKNEKINLNAAHLGELWSKRSSELWSFLIQHPKFIPTSKDIWQMIRSQSKKSEALRDLLRVAERKDVWTFMTVGEAAQMLKYICDDGNWRWAERGQSIQENILRLERFVLHGSERENNQTNTKRVAL